MGNWTSLCQMVNNMVVTTHFIDGNRPHKRIINFRPIDTHKRENTGSKLLECIHRWRIKNVMTITIDNTTSNYKSIEI